MWLESITLKDFRCFFDEHAITLSQNPEKNVTVIHAENGVGKTTLLNAVLWCFYGETTEKFERREDLVNYDAKALGRTTAFVEVLFEHNGSRYRARRYTKGSGQERQFTIMRIEGGHHAPLPNPDTFINTVIPKGMAGHFLFDGEHAEVFLGEDNRNSIRQAVRDILGCTLITTAIGDLADASRYYRGQMPASSSTANLATLTARIEALSGDVQKYQAELDALQGRIEIGDQQIADIDETLRNSAAAKQLQTRRDKTTSELDRARKRAFDAQGEVHRWLGENGRYLVARKITDTTTDYLVNADAKGKVPEPYNQEFITDLLEMQACICGTELTPGSVAAELVATLLKKGADATLRGRVTRVRTRLAELKQQREKAPARLDEANKRLAAARQDISRHEADLHEISAQLSGINFEEIAAKEARRNELYRNVKAMHQQKGDIGRRISDAEAEKTSKDRELRKLAEHDAGSRIVMRRYTLCEELGSRLKKELEDEEREARSVLRHAIKAVLDRTSRKAFRLHMTEDYGISLVNEAGTQLPKSSGENQLLGLAFTAALVAFAKLRRNAQDYRLLRGTVAPLVLDSPFGQLDEAYRRTTAEYVPQMAEQVILMISQSQGSGGVMDALQGRIGEEYVLVRHNKDARDGRPPEIRQFHGKDVEIAHFDAAFDGSSFARVNH